MKRTLMLLTSVLLIATLVAAAMPTASAGGAGSVTAQVVAPPPTGLTVVGTGLVAIKPDRAYLTVGVQAVEPTALAAQDTANRIVAHLVAALGALPSVKNVHTASITLYPRYPQTGPAEATAPHPAGFQAEQVLALTVVSVDKAGTALDTAVRAGANAQIGVSFGISDATAAQRQALAAAVADGRQQAEAAARAAGQRLGRLTAMVVLPQSQPSGLGGGAGGTVILPGTIQIAAAVQMTYAY